MNDETDLHLKGVLDREIAAALALTTTLEAERVALIGDAPQAVIDKAAEKTRLFGLLERLEAERIEICDAAQLTLPPLQRGQPFVTAGVSEMVGGSWRALLDLIAGCRIANNVNGYIINARCAQIGQLLQVIRGGSPTTYGPHGKPFGGTLRELARA
jgi:flagellar biosynthesis/type III secretory pathway chaperone